MTLTPERLIFLALASLAFGYALFLLLFFLLPRKLRSQNKLQRQLILNEAKRKATTLKKEELDRFEDKLTLACEELEGELEQRQLDLESFEEDLKSREDYLQHEQQRVNKLQSEIKNLENKAKARHDIYERALKCLKESRAELQDKLAKRASCDLHSQSQHLVSEAIEQKQLDCTKYLRILAEELGTSSNRLANRILSRTHARYTPEFIWPKGINHVEIKDQRTARLFEGEDTQIIKDLIELSQGVNISIIEGSQDGQLPIIRLAGGYGIYKEAAKLALEEVVHKGPNAWSRIESVYHKHRKKLEAQALDLGKQALLELNLSGVHVEILKMVGSLNWRTSYRQNQYHHSLEVAKLAGILAYELGIDPNAAKRCGLLHDIGKSIDYRIEGSHAVISGDYADRYGESKEICDTVMSHHADLIVETPLAYVLRSADTLSGARPGARVNLEEGYQERVTSIQDVVRAFPGVQKVEIMNGAREVHVEVNHKRIKERDLQDLSTAIARKIEDEVAYPGQIKILVARRFESVAVA